MESVVVGVGEREGGKGSVRGFEWGFELEGRGERGRG